MKRKGLAIMCALAILALALTACGGGDIASSMQSASSGGGTNGAYYDFGTEAPTAAEGETDAAFPEDGAALLANTRLQNAKIIRTANLEMETTAFEDCASGLEALVERLGGYLEYASADNYGTGYRSGSYTARIPAEQFESFLRSAGEIGHVTYQDKSSENISEAYYDTESRLTTQRTKLERLQALLARAENMEDIITIESALAETELAIEQLTGELRRYDALVDFATIYIHLREVSRLSSVEQTPPTFSSRLGTAFSEGWQGFVSGVQGFTLLLAYGWMWLVLLALMILLVVWLRRKHIRWPGKPKAPKHPDGPGSGTP